MEADRSLEKLAADAWSDFWPRLVRTQELYRLMCSPAERERFRAQLVQSGHAADDVAEYDPRPEIAAMFYRYSRRPDGSAPGDEELLEAMIGPSPRLGDGRHGTGTLYTGFPMYDDMPTRSDSKRQ